MLTALALLAALPLLLGCALWLGQERLIFIPDARAIAAPTGWRLETLRTEDDLELRFLHGAARPGAPVVLHFHGNGGNAEDRAELGDVLRRAGYAVLLAEYRGYGGNSGSPGEAAIAADARALLVWAHARFPGARMVLWGESLGSGVVTRLAEGRADIAALVLESPFTSVADVAAAMYPWLPTNHLLRHRFESLARMPGITAPVLVVAAEGDRITPVAQARRMLAVSRQGTGVFLPGGAHPAVLNDPNGEALRRVLEFLAARVPTQSHMPTR